MAVFPDLRVLRPDRLRNSGGETFGTYVVTCCRLRSGRSTPARRARPFKMRFGFGVRRDIATLPPQKFTIALPFFVCVPLE